jgi:hypothetical protein
LISCAFHDREECALRHNRDGSLGTRSNEIRDVHRRDDAGMWVKPDELTPARRECRSCSRCRSCPSPLAGLSFTGGVTTP